MPNPTSDSDITRPDVSLRLDGDGIIREVTLSKNLAAGTIEDWVGRPWVETVADFGEEKAKRMVEEAKTGGVSAFRQLTQCFPNGLELPMEYTTVQLGNGGGLLAVGKSLQAVADLQSRLITAQQAMERDYWKLRYLETRYRLLLDAFNEPVLLVKAANLSIVEASPSAIRELGVTDRHGNALEKIELFDLVSEGDRKKLETMLLRVRDQGKASPILLNLGQSRKTWFVRASMVTSEQGLVYFLQLTPGATPKTEPEQPVEYWKLVQHIPDAFVAIDNTGRIVCNNQAFLTMIQVSSATQLEGQPVARWLGRPGADIKVLLANIALHGSVRLFSTTIQGELGITTEVEISAGSDGSSEPPRIGMVLRDVSLRLTAAERNDRGLNAWLQESTNLIGTSPLRKLVRDTIGVVESHYIEAALALTEGNRTAAAELLGISRQSLYAKMARYGLGTDSDSTA